MAILSSVFSFKNLEYKQISTSDSTIFTVISSDGLKDTCSNFGHLEFHLLQNIFYTLRHLSNKFCLTGFFSFSISLNAFLLNETFKSESY